MVLNMKRPGDEEPEPPGGRAAERLREFLRQRLPPDASTEEAQNETESEGKQETNNSSSDADQKPGA
jgi:hypothetical protein